LTLPHDLAAPIAAVVGALGLFGLYASIIGLIIGPRRTRPRGRRSPASAWQWLVLHLADPEPPKPVRLRLSRSERAAAARLRVLRQRNSLRLAVRSRRVAP
jgi:hypothetical protein